MKSLITIVFVAWLAAGLASASEAQEAFAFWSDLFKGEVTQEHWQPDEDDPPGAAAAKEALSRGLGPVLARCEWLRARDWLTFQAIDDSDTDHIHAALYVDGDMWYAAFVAEEGSKPFRFFFPARRHQYDTLAYRYAGHDIGAATQLEPGRPYFLALFPHRVSGLSLSLTPTSVAPGEQIQANVRLAGTTAPGTHIFRLRVVSPEGQDIEEMAEWITAEKGEEEFAIRVPDDLPPGAYSVSARCAITAAIAAETLEVRP